METLRKTLLPLLFCMFTKNIDEWSQEIPQLTPLKSQHDRNFMNHQIKQHISKHTIQNSDRKKKKN
jgi:hypothetical protein